MRQETDIRKYDVKLKTSALNELLGGPVPNIINLEIIQEEARVGQFAELDKTLGFIDNDGKEVEMLPVETFHSNINSK